MKSLKSALQSIRNPKTDASPATKQSKPFVDEKVELTEREKKARAEAAQAAIRARYTRSEFIWSENRRRPELSRWVPFVPGRITYKPKRSDHLFMLMSRRRKPQEKPEVSVTILSEVLKEPLRTIVGHSTCYDAQPDIPIRVLFSNLSELTRKLAEIQDKSKLTEVTDEDRSYADTFGVEHALEANFADEDVLKALERVAEELEVLLHCVQAEFEPIRKQLALYKAHGQITFEYLEFVFEKGQEVVKYNINNEPEVFVIEETTYTYGMSPSFSLSGSGWWYNGKTYAKEPRAAKVHGFESTLLLSSLPFYHLEPEMKSQFSERGRKYTTYAPGTHYVHNLGEGSFLPTFDVHTQAKLPTLPKGRAIVDTGRRLAGKSSAVEDPSDSPRPARNDLELPIRSLHPLTPPPATIIERKKNVINVLSDDLLHLLPSTIYGFSFASKQFGLIRVMDIAPVIFDEHAWDHLVLEEDSKLLIRSLVEVTKSSYDMIADVITGKGGGLVGLLHGSPGTGKTLTAEAVAEHLRRPLYMVSAGELSLDAPTLEVEFKDILQRATDWNAVLLIDEADVFLEQRSHHELHRNSIVSVTLRLLEYHQGVLFLTTNRITAFDEAFLSRFSIAIRYPDLDIDKKRVVWQRFLALAGATEHEEEGKPYVSSVDVERLATKPFNGRTVKNLVRTAQALARAEDVPLSIKHIDVVARISEKFLKDFAEIGNGGEAGSESKNMYN